MVNNSQKAQGMTDKEYTSKHGKWNAPAIAIIASVLGSGGGLALVVNSPVGSGITRPDPFTGTEGEALTERVDHTESMIDSHIFAHPDIVSQYDRRIATLEAQYQAIIANQERILNRLDGR